MFSEWVIFIHLLSFSVFHFKFSHPDEGKKVLSRDKLFLQGARYHQYSKYFWFFPLLSYKIKWSFYLGIKVGIMTRSIPITFRF